MDIKKIIINSAFIFIEELILHVIMFKQLDFYLLYILGFSIVIGLLITTLSSLTHDKPNKIINISLLLFIGMIFVAQLVHFKFYSAIFSIYSLVNGGQVFGFFSAIMKVIKNNIISVIVIILPIIVAIYLTIKEQYNSTKFKMLFLQDIGGIVLLILLIFSLNLDKDSSYSAKSLFKDTHVPTIMTKKLGLITTMNLDLKRTIFKSGEKLIVNYGDNNNNKTAEYNKLDIDFDKLIKNEKNENIKNLHYYFKNETATQKNQYTGMFKGKNLIVIVAEAFSPIAIDKDLTPTLYKLYNSGFKFNNFYTPLFYVSTSDGEYISLTSLLPKEGVWSFQESSNNYLPFVYGNLLKKQGYSAWAYHDGSATYYKRNLSHPNMGYNFKACKSGLEKKINCKIWPQSDLEMINATFDDYKNKDKFVTYYMTISGHLNYTYNGNMMATKNKNKVNNLPYSEAIQAYMATQIELDKAVESLIYKLKESNKLDDTVIVISADHYPYGLYLKEIKEKANYINDEKFDIHKNNLIIWNNKMTTPIEINKSASSLDILPTVLNLFGAEYDSRLLAGKDILSNSEGIVIFNDRSWITDYGKYDAIKKTFIASKKVKNEDEYVKRINSIVYNRFSSSRMILETNYYNYLGLK